MTGKFVPRPLHLHTIESLCADLVSGRPVATAGEGDLFRLEDDRARSALEWYRRRGAAAWPGQVTVLLAEQLVDALLGAPPDLPVASEAGGVHQNRILTLKRLEAHRFAGLHRFGTPDRPPQNFTLELSSPIQLFEGSNGSGKTSLANAVIWALTGDILRPQREPEKGTEEFNCRIDVSDSGNSPPTLHKTCPVTPLPDPKEHLPERGWIHADTWVELTFVDETGMELPPIRRSVSRTPGGKIHEGTPGFSGLGIDPISLRIGTVMPGLLPLIRIGSESELGRAVAQLTGLAALADLSDNVRRARTKIDKEFVKRETQNIERADESYGRARTDLLGEMDASASIRPAEGVPLPSGDPNIESTVDRINAHFLAQYTTSVSAAKCILGDTFDPSDGSLRADLENNIGAAISEVRQLRLDSLGRLKSLRSLTAEELSWAKEKITELIRDATALSVLARDPSREARLRLYAMIALWVQEHPRARRDLCVVCGASLEDVKDPVTGRLVKDHIHEAGSSASLMSQTLKRWADVALGDLTQHLAAGLRRELEFEDPEHPCDLIRRALTDELFETAPFKGVLSGVRAATSEALGLIMKDRPALPSASPIRLPAGCAVLEAALFKLDRGIRFAQWRRSHDEFCAKIFAEVIGRPSGIRENEQSRTLAGKLSELDSMVKSVAPLTRAMTFCERLKSDLQTRRTAEKRLGAYAVASAALEKLLPLGDIADLQVARLRQELKAQASKWRDSVYQAGFPAAAYELLDTRTSRKGHLELIVGAGGVSAPAHHVTNASALRASLVGFYFAFWEYVLKERGGLRLMVLDDPQELFDEVNRERLGETLPKLVEVGAQLLVMTHDRRFAGYVARLRNECPIEHRSVHPATNQQPVLRAPLSVADIARKRVAFEADMNSEQTAGDFAGECRVHIETMLSDLFDEPAYSGWVNGNARPTLSTYVDKIRALSRTSPKGMFGATVFTRFVDHPGVSPTSATGKLLNKPHHEDKRWITAAEVAACSKDLNELVELADKMHEERRRWRHKGYEVTDGASTAVPALESLDSVPVGSVRIAVCPDLAAFTREAPSGESQEALEYLDPTALESRALFHLQRDNFGFAGPRGSIAIVKTEASPAGDRTLVIARDGARVYARRVLRGEQPGWIGLAGETPDPRRSPRTRFFRENEVELHEVVGILFPRNPLLSPGKDEATPVEDLSLLRGIDIAYRVTEESAIPLVLPKQIALGGRSIPLDSFDQHEGDLAALILDDGSSIFKRVGASLPGNLSYLREFESIGGLGSSRTLAVGKPYPGLRSVVHARLIVGVLYGP